MSVPLRCTKAPASAPGDLRVETPDDVIDVPYELAVDLLRIKDGGWAEAVETEPEQVTPIEE